jgi:hypothetical protein
MKLAEALIQRADRQRRLHELRDRLLRNAKVQEGDAPAEAPQALLAELDAAASDLERLIRAINATNLQTQLVDMAGTAAEVGLGDEATLTDALALRDVLRIRTSAYRDLAKAASVQQQRYSRSEVRFVSTVDVEVVQREADRLARHQRQLDAAIQATNWQADLLEEGDPA